MGYGIGGLGSEVLLYRDLECQSLGSPHLEKGDEIEDNLRDYCQGQRRKHWRALL